MTCHMADHHTGFWYLATMSLHAGRLDCCSDLDKAGFWTIHDIFFLLDALCFRTVPDHRASTHQSEDASEGSAGPECSTGNLRTQQYATDCAERKVGNSDYKKYRSEKRRVGKE